MGRHKPKQEDHGGGMERWLLTYADLITLLMAFFIIMYAMSTVDAAKYAAIAESLKVALGGEPAGATIIPTVMTGGKTKDKNNLKEAKPAAIPNLKQLKNYRDAKEQREFAEMIKKIQDYTKNKGIASSLEAKEDARGVVINLSDKVLFGIGKADLSPAAMVILDDLAKILFSSSKHIKVEGHTDNIPISNAEFPSNWHLSTARATNVIIYWINRYPQAASKLSAAGYGEHRPVATNGSPWGRSKNRRVEIVVLRDLLSIGEPSSADPSKAEPAAKPTAPATKPEPAKNIDLGEKLPGD